MSEDDDAAVRAAAVEAVRAALGIEPTAEALFDRLSRQLPAAEVAAIRQTPPEEMCLADLAAVSSALDHLGADWWHDARVRRYDGGELADDRSPAMLVRSPGELQRLSHWAQDDLADHLWGPWADYYDEDDEIEDVVAPPETEPGDRIVLNWDVGGRVYAVVQERAGKLGIRLDGELMESPATLLWWNWMTATEPQTVTEP